MVSEAEGGGGWITIHEEVESRARAGERAGERAAWRRESEARVADHLLRQPPQLVAFSSSPSVQKLNIVFGNAGVGNGNPAKNALLFGDGHGRFVLDSLFSELASRATRGRSPRATSTAMGTSISWLATTRPTPPSHRARTSSSSGKTGGFLPPTNRWPTLHARPFGCGCQRRRQAGTAPRHPRLTPRRL